MDIEFTRGDTKIIKFKLKDKDGKDLKISDTDKLYFTVKKDAKSTNRIIQKTIGNGIKLIDDYFYITINSDDTSNLNYGNYGYDIEIKTETGIVKTLIIGSITLTEEFTHKGDEI